MRTEIFLRIVHSLFQNHSFKFHLPQKGKIKIIQTIVAYSGWGYHFLQYNGQDKPAFPTGMTHLKPHPGQEEKRKNNWFTD